MIQPVASPLPSLAATNWEAAGAFRAGRPERARAKPYTIVIPPPNVTGSLHMGHALNNTLQDILCRFERMRGATCCGSRAPIMPVSRRKWWSSASLWSASCRAGVMGREAFLERVWEWKAESGGTIVKSTQAAWRFVRLVARALYDGRGPVARGHQSVRRTLQREGLIYKDKRLVNWDPRLLTAISDLEVVQQSRPKAMWHFAIRWRAILKIAFDHLWSRPRGPRPCSAMAPSPCIPTTSATSIWSASSCVCHWSAGSFPSSPTNIPTRKKARARSRSPPAHDFNDFEVGTRHRNKPNIKKQKNGGLINLFTREAKMNENCPPNIKGSIASKRASASSPAGSARPPRQDRAQHACRARMATAPAS
jgi:valyl-tRNA synthetase